MMKVSKYVLYDILRSKIVLAYTLFLLIVSLSMFNMEENSSKAMLSLLNIVLIVLPLVSLVFTTIHYYNSYEFIELMSSQPMSRTRIIISEFAGVSISLLSAFLLGVGLPILIYAPDETGFALVFTGMALTVVFVAIAFFASVWSRDKARSDYPLEKITLPIISLNPIDVGRIFVTLKMDISALMGVTSALYKDFFTSSTGLLFTVGIMLLWTVLPLWLAIRRFNKKDL